MRRSGAIIFLAALYFLAAKIGGDFGQVVTIFTVLIWMIAAGLFAYLMLFRGVKLSFFGFGREAAEAAEAEAAESRQRQMDAAGVDDDA